MREYSYRENIKQKKALQTTVKLFLYYYQIVYFYTLLKTND